MQDQEASEVRGGVVADDCGVGKTIQTLALIYQQWQIKFDFAKSRSGFKTFFAVDTQNVVKACGMTSAIGQSLALIVQYYKLATLSVWYFEPPYNKQTPKLYFIGQHYAFDMQHMDVNELDNQVLDNLSGTDTDDNTAESTSPTTNDAQKTLEAALSLLVDKHVLSIDSREFSEPRGAVYVHKYLSAAMKPKGKTNTVLFSFDTETVYQSNNLRAWCCVTGSFKGFKHPAW